MGLVKVIPMAACLFGLGLITFLFEVLFALIGTDGHTGLGMMLQMASSNTIIQTIVDDDKRGRVMSFYTMAFMGTALLEAYCRSAGKDNWCNHIQY